MTKKQEQDLINTVEQLKKQVAELHSRLENNKVDKHVYSVAETSKILGVTPQAVYAMIERKELETIKLGHKKILGESLRAKLGVVKSV